VVSIDPTRNIMLTFDEYMALRRMIGSGFQFMEPSVITGDQRLPEESKPKTRRKSSAYNRKYKAAFKKVAPRYKLKSGKWKAGGFKRAVKEAHKMAGGKKR